MSVSQGLPRLSVKRCLGGASVLLPLFLVTYFFWQKEDEKIQPDTEISALNSDSFKEAPVSQNQLEDGTYFDHESDFHKVYGSEQGTLQTDLEIVAAVLGHVRILIKDLATLPLADNQNFTRLLTGNNKQKFAWIHPQHPAISPQGELMDRLGSPLFFHRVSALRTEVRSAGEDRQMWTEDDVTVSSSNLGAGLSEEE